MGRTDPIHTALTGLVRALEETEVPYMIVGGMAVVLRGHPRFTRDIDALADVEALLALHGRKVDRKRLTARVRALSKDLGDEDAFELWSVLSTARMRRRRTR